MARSKRIAVLVAFLLVVASLTFWACVAFGEAPTRVPIAEYAVAHEGLVHVSDLLPSNVNRAMRERAAGIVVGEAPAPGSVRDFSRERIETALRGDVALRSELEIPPMVHVTRWARILSSDEVLRAVARSLEASKLPESSTVAGASVRWAAPVYLASEDSVPEATSVDLSGGDGVIRARIWIPFEPRVTPFWVELHSAKAAALDPVSVGPARLPVTPTRASRTNRSVLMVQSGKTVMLVLTAPGMQITTNAAAMQSGGPGDQIRVRVLPSGKQFVARVVGPSEVETNY